MVREVDVVVVGAGLAGLATACYLSRNHGMGAILLIDCRPMMSYTTATSGNNYRNWWPHPVMTAFTNRSIDLMEDVARASGNVLRMSRRGYAVASRQRNVDAVIDELNAGYGESCREVRVHSQPSASYDFHASGSWEDAPDGIDLITDAKLLRGFFPSFHPDVKQVMHVRRAGDIDGQQLGQYLWKVIKARGGEIMAGEVMAITRNRGYHLDVKQQQAVSSVKADVVVNAAGPFCAKLAGMLAIDLPLVNVFQQKIAVEDSAGLVPRDMPFAVDRDPCVLPWSAEEAEGLREDPSLGWLLGPIPGAVHCRPEGGRDSQWIKLGWAYRETPGTPDQAEALQTHPHLDANFPEIVMRGAARLQPKLQRYVRDMPRKPIHYGGYYTMTEENWPLIGPLDGQDAYVVGALSGFGSMAACAAGELCADWIAGAPGPEYANALSLARYRDEDFIDALRKTRNKGLL